MFKTVNNSGSTFGQHGVSLVEVLIALLLLSTVALGYSALQARSLNAMNDTNLRISALLILDEAAERMRAHHDLVDMSEYQTHLIASALPAITDCLAIGGCNAAQSVKNDVVALRQHANDQGITLGMVTCPGTANYGDTRCLVAAWNDTLAQYATVSEITQGTAENIGCLYQDGTYLKDADCIYRETY